jgi:hypothetical protein
MGLAPAQVLSLPAEWDDGDAQAIQHGPLRVLVSPHEDHAEDGQWRHVSVSCEDRLPTYEELGAVRELYFPADQTVLQVMPPASAWINEHAFCLHLWQRLDQHILPKGLHRTVGIVGSVPKDDTEIALMRHGRLLAASLRNLLRAKGELTIRQAADALRHLYAGGSETALRGEIRQTLAALCQLDAAIRPPVDGQTYRWRPA